MIEIRYTPGLGAEISGSAEELVYARRTLLALAGLGKSAAGIQVGYGYDPAPFEHALGLLVFKRGRGPLRRYVVATRALVVEGSEASLAGFARRLALVAGLAVSRGPSSGAEPAVAPDAVPTAIVLRD